MSKKYKKHGYAERLKYMHMLEDGYSTNYIHIHLGIRKDLLEYLWIRYQAEGSSALLKKKNVKPGERYAELEGDGELIGMEAITENQVEHKVFS